MDGSGSFAVAADWLDGSGSPAPNPPAKLILLLDGFTGWQAPAQNAAVSGTGASDGLGDPLAPFSNTSSVGGNSTGKHLLEYDSSSGTVSDTISQSASVTAQSGDDEPIGNDVWIGHTLTASEVVMTLDAHSTADTANWDPTHPRFFSGTNCTVAANVGVGAAIITEAMLSIGGQPVADAHFAEPQSSASFNCTFDSTAFSDGEAIPIDFKIWDAAGDPPIDKTISASAYNKAYVLGNDTMYSMDPQEVVVDVHKDLPSTISNDDYNTADYAAAIIANLPTYTVFYDNTHGAPGMFWGCQDDGSGPDIVYAADVENAVNQDGGAGQKGLLIPPYNFVHMDSCDVGEDVNIANAFGVNGQTDCAFLGYSTFLADTQMYINWTNDVWTQLAAGYKLATVINHANHAYPPDANAISVSMGDDQMTLHGVYGGVDGDTVEWFHF